MATRRRIGISAATTEAARRQLMQPVPCWEKAWVAPTDSPAGSSLKVFKWVQTEKIQQFSDEEGEVDEPLAPLPDEPEVGEGDEDIDPDEAISAIVPEATQIETADTDVVATQEVQETQEEIASKPASPQPQLSMSLQTSSDLGIDPIGDTLDASLNPIETGVIVGIDVGEKLNPENEMELDMAGLGPDGLGLEASHDLSQMEAADALIGGAMMDQSEDPFAESVNE
ncbi:hypothetical protein BDZ94DRAFT_1198457 [Collybia nuda]|uniref:Uncharacterized protein n=1 Tax=Collybia nuda TaxID=64659 RepID=A0A9P5XZX1_9AGAR|nr:hypothetical protein BDZ94DRAFT_1198457 [Collybia nuda]